MKTYVKRIKWLWRAGLKIQAYLIKKRVNLACATPSKVGYEFDSRAPAPTFEKLTSQLVTGIQFLHPRYEYWCGEIRSLLRFNRKTWEFNYILEALSQQGMLAPGKKGLGFGCGQEPLPAVMIDHGCSVVASDQAFDSAHEQGWTATKQHAHSLAMMNPYKIVSDQKFTENCSFRVIDMNNIPSNFRNHQFDFVWSSCAFEHLGSIRAGLDFVKSAMECLKPGGVAVHTSEFNVSSNAKTMEHRTCVVFRKSDIETLVRELTDLGYEVFPLNLHPGTQPVDRVIDIPPYIGEPNLKLMLEEYVVTSIGLIVRKAD